MAMDLSTEEKIENFAYNGNGSEYAFLFFKNLLLTICTLGIYSAWGRTNNRRYVWGATSFMGDRATYTGQGKELFVGWAFVGAIYLVGYIVITLLSTVSPFIGFLIMPLYAYIYSLIIYGGTRYRLAKTSWRGIRFGLDKNKQHTRDFIFLVFKYGLISIFTLGIATPLFLHEVRKFLVDKSRFGTSYFIYAGDRREFFFLCIKGFLLTIVTFGIFAPWFQCRIMKFRLENTKFQDATFKVNLTGKDLFIFTWGSFFGMIFTAGIATPWLINWSHKIIINSIQVVGNANFDKIENLASTGEAMADVAAVEYDIDLAF
jgi:uncharacterized membrane protein YjgN (DUF898 family)